MLYLTFLSANVCDLSVLMYASSTLNHMLGAERITILTEVSDVICSLMRYS